jgi:colicin import membrane protein
MTFNIPLKIITLTLPLLLISCSHYPAKTDPEAIPGSVKSTNVDDLLRDLQSEPKPTKQAKISAYAAQIRSVMVKKIPSAEAYVGKVCTIRISLQRDGLVNNATAEAGDEKFCRMLISAITHTQFPAAPDEETYQVFKNAHFDFKP